MQRVRLKRGVAVAATLAMGTTVGGALVMAPANADVPAYTVRVTEIQDRESETTYTQWHEGDVTVGREADAFSLEWDGLHFGDRNDSQVMKGLDEPRLIEPAMNCST